MPSSRSWNTRWAGYCRFAGAGVLCEVAAMSGVALKVAAHEPAQAASARRPVSPFRERTPGWWLLTVSDHASEANELGSRKLGLTVGGVAGAERDNLAAVQEAELLADDEAACDSG